MAKRRISNYVFLPGTASSSNAYPNAYSLISRNATFITQEAVQYIANQATANAAQNLYLNAVSLLTSNASFIANEISAWITNQVATATVGTTFYGYVFNDAAKAKYIRDTGTTVTALINDIRYGGTEQSIFAASQYYLSGTLQVTNQAVEVAAQSQLWAIINNYVLSNVVYPSQQSPVVAAQSLSGSSAESVALTKSQSISVYITNVINGGLSVLPASTPPTFPYVNYVYDSAKYVQDIGIVVAAYLNDLRYGGNYQTSLTASRYWNNGSPLITGSRIPEVLTHQFIAVLINNYILTQAAYTPLQNVVQRYTNGSITYETAAAARITTLSGILTAVMQNGVGSLPALVNGVTTIKLQGIFRLEQLLLITDTTTNTILYNFSDSSHAAGVNLTTTYGANTTYPDSDFPAFKQTADYVTVITFDIDTTTALKTDGIQIFVEDKEIRTRPYDFGTDAIERQRVAPPQSMLDADFEYGLQPTKWQAIGIARGYPSIYEVPGTDISVVSVSTDASTGTNNIGSSLITVTTVSPHAFTIGTPFTITAFSNSVTGFSRAQGSFLVNSVTTPSTFTYYATSKVGLNSGDVLSSNYTQLRKGAFYTGASIGNPAFTVFSNGATGSFTTQFTTPPGSNQIAFSGTPPVSGVPVSGTGINTGTQVTGTVGSGGLQVTANVATPISIGDTSFTVVAATGILGGFAIDNGTGAVNYVTSLTGNTVTLSSPFTASYAGNIQTYYGVSGTNIVSSGSGAVFSVTRIGGVYSINITTAGSGYSVSNRVKILGNSLGGVTPNNDLIISVTSVNGTGAVTGTSVYSGSGISGESTFANISASTSGAGVDARLTITTLLGAYQLALNNGGIAYAIGDTLTILGTSLGGTTPGNNLVVTVTAVNAQGSITDLVQGSITTYSNIPADSTVSVAGSTALFTVSKLATTYTLVLNNGGTNYRANDTLTILGTSLGGAAPANNLVITVTNVNIVTGAIVNFTIAGTAISTVPAAKSSNALFTTLIGTNVALGSGATFNITRNSGVYTATANLGGSLYAVNDVVKILGTSLGGATPANDVLVTVVTLSGTAVATASTSGTASSGASISFYSTVSLSDFTTATIANATTVNTAAIGKIQITFANNHGLVPGTSILVNITSTGTNHALANGPCFIEQTPSLNTVIYTARTSGIIDTAITLIGQVYAKPNSFFIHRPFDGGVQLGTGGPQHGAQAIRMSKKYIRYQSGKGIMYTTGALFAPSYNIASLSASGTAVGSLITLSTDDTDHGLQTGGKIRIVGVDTAGYNGTYIVTSIIDERTLNVRAQTVLGNIYASISTVAQMTVSGWHGASVRAGTFDDQNGMFFQYDGRYLSCCRRSSTYQLSGTVSVVVDTNAVTGVGTRFRDQLKAGDRIVIRGMTHVVSAVTSQTSLSVTPDYRGTNNVVAAKACLIQDFVTPQGQWNLDNCDGTGPSGYNIDIGKMQMIGLQWSWYGAGFIDYMMRGSDGNFVFVHRIRNSNVNTEAYMRTGNMPVRYEVVNESAVSKLSASISASATTIPLTDTTYFPTDSCIVYIDNELIFVGGKSGNNLINCVRAAPMVNFVAGSTRTYTAGSATTHEINTGVILVDNTISPIISHWGSAFVTDGGFDSDRGYLFNYASTGLSATTTIYTAFLVRLAPSVSNAVIGDLGDRELINRAQLLLKEIQITSDGYTGVGNTPVTGGIVVQGILNPQNYPVNPAAIGWTGLSSSAAGGQPSFVQVAPGGSVSWSGGASNVTSTATTIAAPTAQISLPANVAFNTAIGTTVIYVSKASWDASGAATGYAFATTDTRFSGGTTVTSVSPSAAPVSTIRGQITASIASVFATNANNNILFLSQNGVDSNKLVTGVFIVDASFPTGTTVTGIVGPFNSSGINYYQVNLSANALSGHGPGQSNVSTLFGIGGANGLGTYTAGTTVINFTQASWSALPIATGVTGNTVNDTKFAIGTTISNIGALTTFGGVSYYPVTFSTGITTAVTNGATVTLSTIAYYTLTLSVPTLAPLISLALTGGTLTSNVANITFSTQSFTPYPVGTYVTVTGSTGVPTAAAFNLITAPVVSGGGNSSVSFTNVATNQTGLSGGLVTPQISLTPAIVPTNTSFLYFSQASWETLVGAYSAATGTLVVTPTYYPSGTTISSVSTLLTFGVTSYYRVTFTQTSLQAVAAATAITFQFGLPAYALPGETVFSFIAAPGTTTVLDLSDLKELTNTTLGGRGCYPNGPDVLAINLYRSSGTGSVPTNILVRWSEAQA